MATIRPSPSQHAADLKAGIIARGNDGARWIVKDFAGGARLALMNAALRKSKNLDEFAKLKKSISCPPRLRWVRIPDPPGRTYLTHDNGGSPFKVVINGNDVVVLALDVGFQREVYLKTVFRHKRCKNIWIGRYRGRDYPTRADPGNSVLLQTGVNAYVFIGDCIATFTTPEPISAYQSPIGNSDVPYPWATSAHFIYLMAEHVMFSIDEIGPGKDPYAYYYGLKPAAAKRLKRKQLTRYRLLHPRICA